MNRYWVSWWSSYHIKKGCTKPPFQLWISGERGNSNTYKDEYSDEVSIVAVIDAESEEEIWGVVEKHFPDYEERFCDSVPLDYCPSDRFPGFNNETSLYEL